VGARGVWWSGFRPCVRPGATSPRSGSSAAP
jgi:hypothetical protein